SAMPFRLTDAHRERFYHHNHVVFERVLPVSLVRDLRRATEPGRAMARERWGPQVQRLQPAVPLGLDIKPFQDYAELPQLPDAIASVMGDPNHHHGGIDSLGVLYEPGERHTATAWHRDITARSPGIDPEEFARIDADPTFFAQINCALYTDVCT